MFSFDLTNVYVIVPNNAIVSLEPSVQVSFLIYTK